MIKMTSVIAACAGLLIAIPASAANYQPVAPTVQIDVQNQFWTYMIRDAVIDVKFERVRRGQPFVFVLERDPTADIAPVVRWPSNVVWANGSAPDMNVASITISGFFDGNNYVVTYVVPKYTR